MDFSFWFDTINLGLSIEYIEGKQVIIVIQYCISLNIVSVLVNSADPDAMPYYAAFHLGLHVCQSEQLGVSSIQ